MAVTKKTYNAVMDLYAHMCAECNTSNGVELHHKLPREKWAAKKFPLFIDSPMNLVPLCNGFENACHENCKNKYKIREREAEVIESYLESL